MDIRVAPAPLRTVPYNYNNESLIGSQPSLMKKMRHQQRYLANHNVLSQGYNRQRLPTRVTLYSHGHILSEPIL